MLFGATVGNGKGVELGSGVRVAVNPGDESEVLVGVGVVGDRGVIVEVEAIAGETAAVCVLLGIGVAADQGHGPNHHPETKDSSVRQINPKLPAITIKIQAARRLSVTRRGSLSAASRTTVILS